jgi:hypothetical protein
MQALCLADLIRICHAVMAHKFDIWRGAWHLPLCFLLLQAWTRRCATLTYCQRLRRSAIGIGRCCAAASS